MIHSAAVTVCHILSVPLAAWRITELFAQDEITRRLRERFPGYLWTCPRCLSVWAGAAAAAIFVFLPWLNWPFALAWLYLWQIDSRAHRRGLAQRQLVVRVSGGNVLEIYRQELTGPELEAVLRGLQPKDTPPAQNAPGAVAISHVQ